MQTEPTLFDIPLANKIDSYYSEQAQTMRTTQKEIKRKQRAVKKVYDENVKKFNYPPSFILITKLLLDVLDDILAEIKEELE